MLILLLILSGCACKTPPVTIPVSCVQVVPVREPSVFLATPPEADIADQVAALLIDRDLTEIYIGGVDAIVAGCR